MARAPLVRLFIFFPSCLFITILEKYAENKAFYGGNVWVNKPISKKEGKKLIATLYFHFCFINGFVNNYIVLTYPWRIPFRINKVKTNSIHLK
jgi:hypothetical protein